MPNMFAVNTVLGTPEPEFRAVWVSILWNAMFKTKKGYRQQSMKRTGRPEFIGETWNWEVRRRKDKPEITGP